jgi:hydroxypyruvate reductase
MTLDPPALLRDLFDTAVAVADPMRVVAAHLGPKPTTENPAGRVIVIGAGKASARMAEAVEAAWGPCDGLVITRYGYARPTKGISIIQAAHPVPDQAGMAATQNMLDMVSNLTADDTVVALISGGGSALLCAPRVPMTLDDKQNVHRALLASGASIGKMNVVRKHLSAIKGGQLAAAVHPATLLTLMISDVAGDDPADIASGPTVADSTTAADARQIVADYGMVLPARATAALTGDSAVVAPDDPRLSRAETRIIAAPSQSLNAAAAQATAAGLQVEILGDALEGEAADLGAKHARLALGRQATLTAGDRPILLLSGGECTVTRHASAHNVGDGAEQKGAGGHRPGVGGPNAEYALAAAMHLQGAEGIHLIACDTDGVDGAAEVAGALICPDILARAAARNLDVGLALADHDSHRFFARLGAQVVTGPTLTNVNDFRAILIEPPLE